MKVFSSEIKIAVLVIIGIAILLSALICNTLMKYNKITNELTSVAESHGLKDIKINIGGKMSDHDLYTVTVESSDFENLTYAEMIVLTDSMQIGNVFISQYTSNGNSYVVYPYTKSIYKNGENIYDDYQNSESHKDAAKSKKEKPKSDSSNNATSSYSLTPHRSPSNSNDDDPYNTKNYSNEEDFYYDHYDDFFDYYDAENYYNEHKY